MKDDSVRVAYLGMGIMGSAMAVNLSSAAVPTTVWNRTAGTPGAEAARAAGCTVAGTVGDAVRDADVIFTCLSDVPDVESVLLGTEGVRKQASTGALIIDMSTIGPQAARHLAKELSQHGLRFLDAPVTGGDIGARNATLTIMVGGAAEDLAFARPLLEHLGKTIVHCGPCGAGQAVKLCNQVLCAVNMVSVCEAFALADRLGIERQLVVDVCSKGAGGSWALANLGQRIVADDLGPAFMIRHILKDLRLVFESIDGSFDTLPGTALATRLFKEVAAYNEGGGADLGTQAMIQAYSERRR